MPELAKSWEEAQLELKTNLGETIFATWISPLKFSSKDNLSIELVAPDQFFKDWVEKHYLGLIQEALKTRGLDKLLVSLVVSSQPENFSVSAPTPEIEIKKCLSPGQSILIPGILLIILSLVQATGMRMRIVWQSLIHRLKLTTHYLFTAG